MIELPVIDAASSAEGDQKKHFWRSIQHLRQDPHFKRIGQEEFMPGASDAPGGSSRRQFLQLMGASMALAGLSACRRPVELTLPYARKPEEIIPGIPLFYATSMPFRGVLSPLLVESHEGRPTKVEGNPDHPMSMGASGVFEQASLLNLYDPDRSAHVTRGGNQVSWADFVAFSQGFLAQAASRKVAVLCAPSSSPTQLALRGRLAQVFPQLRWVTYAPEGDDAERMGMQAAYGMALRPSYRFEHAEVIVSLDADFLSPTDRNFVANTRGFAASRKMNAPQDEISRLYVVESTYSVTGGSADNRLRLRSSQIPSFAAALAVRLGVEGVQGVGAEFIDHPYVQAMERDLLRAGSHGVVLAGETQPASVHALCMAINKRLSSIGNTVMLYDTKEEVKPAQSEQLQQLVFDMGNGSVDALLMLGVNPVYDMPGELDFAGALQRVPTSIHLGSHQDETAVASTWHIPQAHYLEAWGDGRAHDGTLSVIQPLIAPLHDDARSDIEVLNAFATGLDVSGYDLVRDTWRPVLSNDFEAAWKKVIHDGFLPDSGFATVDPAMRPVSGASPYQVAGDELEVVFRLDGKVLDGSFANNAWLQELPDSTTKVVWDNVALISPATAERLGLEVPYVEGKHYADRIEITAGGTTVDMPVWIVPGHADNSLTVTLGYGRDIVSHRPDRVTNFFDTDDQTDIYGHGAVATGVGVNVAKLRTPGAMRIATGATVRKVGSGYMVATTQDHGYMEGRPLYRMATVEEYREEPGFAADAVETLPGGEPWADYPALWQERHPTTQPAFKDNPYHEYQWAMVIDLNTCTGCNACVVACQSENNVQVVGKDQVSRGRELHWIRMDRYFVSEEGGEADPKMVMQPVMCMHCENAPCESVCPVAATVHSPDGTNQMIYNRCIGTRYCANNCPYKVRRFNYYNWSKTLPLEVHMAQNPNVTVRSRGVMEKCSFCIQRVRKANIRSSLENRSIQEGEVQSACQQACPAGAIVFGNINDPNSKVSKARQDNRRYEMLAELSTKPRASYLGRVTNPNPELERATA
ncbi:MAG: TAT-variant-translocated molybdopterin oxidoreductase [Rhodothermales bacterium]